MSSPDLRSELGVTSDPDFDLTLPPGWARHGVDETAQNLMIDGLRTRLMREHRPAGFAELRPLITQAFEGMRREGAFAIFAATEPEPSTLWIPASIVASTRRADAGRTLDDLVRGLIRDHGATALHGDRSVVRFERERVVRLAGSSVINQSVIYLVPVPGAGRRRALQLVAGFGRPAETPPDHPVIVATKILFDSCVSTLRWLPHHAT